MNQQLQGAGAEEERKGFEKGQNTVTEATKNIRTVTSLQCENRLLDDFCIQLAGRGLTFSPSEQKISYTINSSYQILKYRNQGYAEIFCQKYLLVQSLGGAVFRGQRFFSK